MKRIVMLSAVAALVAAGNASALTMSSVDGNWQNPVGGGSTIEYLNGISAAYGNHSEDQVRWGDPVGSQKSGLGFTGVGTPLDFEAGDTFEIGQLRHFNYPVYDPVASSVDLALSMSFTDPAGMNGAYQFTFGINETPNNFWGQGDDFIYFPTTLASESYTFGNMIYSLELLGFGDTSATLVSQFTSKEKCVNDTKLWGRITTTTTNVPDAGATVALLGMALTGLAFLRSKIA